MGGENSCTPALRISGIGSSPPGRGKLSFTANLLDLCRLIPARAGKTVRRMGWTWERAAHPRMGGENIPAKFRPSQEQASSPHGRGKLLAGPWAPTVNRLIPAWAGKTKLTARPDPRYRAHPRMGGENSSSTPCCISCTGSSPHGRGKLTAGCVGDRRSGLIPARAGKTAPCRSPNPANQAHPRAGGENALPVLLNMAGQGSSPRGRGKHLAAAHGSVVGRRIPAWAGKTGIFGFRAQCDTAHPRVGGENPLCPPSFGWQPGSSPRGRGKLQVKQLTHSRVGLIPARAGKTGAPARSATPHAAHPRAGGENYKFTLNKGSSSGSSPRGRGKLHIPGLPIPCSRLIPARAGKTRSWRCWASCAWAHPRVGGENMMKLIGFAITDGSSPRGRGKLNTVVGWFQTYGLIPARAGKTTCVCSACCLR